MKIINEEDIRKANNIEKCELLISIIKRTSNIYSRHENSLRRNKL